MNTKLSFRRTHRDKLQDVSAKKNPRQNTHRVNSVKQQEPDYQERFLTMVAVAGLVIRE